MLTLEGIKGGRGVSSLRCFSCGHDGKRKGKEVQYVHGYYHDVGTVTDEEGVGARWICLDCLKNEIKRTNSLTPDAAPFYKVQEEHTQYGTVQALPSRGTGYHYVVVTENKTTFFLCGYDVEGDLPVGTWVILEYVNTPTGGFYHARRPGVLEKSAPR
jgi:hypothetical protein